MNNRTSGFTVIEILFTVVILAAAGVLFFVQKDAVETAARDDKRKTAINAMYYSLEEVYYEANGYYPRSISSDVLPSVDPALFTDPSGNEISDASSSYRYTATNCTDDKCKSYTLRTTLENEADFIKESKNS